VSTVWLQLSNNAVGAGMGTAGLVGPLATYATMSGDMNTTLLVVEIIGLYFVAPAIISLAIDYAMRRAGWVQAGDMKLG
jgi:uncharacterized membrane protein